MRGKYCTICNKRYLLLGLILKFLVQFLKQICFLRHSELMLSLKICIINVLNFYSFLERLVSYAKSIISSELNKQCLKLKFGRMITHI